MTSITPASHTLSKKPGLGERFLGMPVDPEAQRTSQKLGLGSLLTPAFGPQPVALLVEQFRRDPLSGVAQDARLMLVLLTARRERPISGTSRGVERR